MRFALLALSSLLIVSACGGGDAKPDAAAHDAAADATNDAGKCGSDVQLVGEFVDWDSSDSQFCGIFQATWQVHNDPTRVIHTAPNGRIQLCLARSSSTQIDITQPTDPSQCSQPAATYTLPGIAIVSQAVIATGATYSARSFTTSEIRALGVTIDPNKGQVFVHVDGSPRAVTITSLDSDTLAFDGATWTHGNTGVNVFFANVDLTANSTAIQIPNAVGTGAVPLSAGTITYTTVHAN